jgi:hypothetical protein
LGDAPTPIEEYAAIDTFHVDGARESAGQLPAPLSTYCAFPERKDEAMIARFDHRPVLIALALAAAVCVLLVVVALFVTAVQPAPPSLPSVSPAGVPAHSAIVKTMIL